MTFTQKLLSCQFQLATGSFGSGGNSATISGLRMTARIVKPGGVGLGAAELSVYGLSLDIMNRLTTYGPQLNVTGRNTVIIQAGETATGMATVFQGTITLGFVDARSQPQVAFRVNAQAGGFEASNPVPATSISGAGDVVTMLSSLASQMSLIFENNGVSAKLADPSYNGSGRDQAYAIAEDAGIELIIDNGILAIWPKGQARSGSATQINPQTGMRDYPAFNSQGIVVETLFDPTLKYGGQITVTSDLKPACGTWVIYRLEYDLASLVPKGPWFCLIDAARPGQVPVAS